jgi:TRAP-type C4-dicarboxylate transport system substrate-binding protein
MKRTILMLITALFVHGASPAASARTIKLGTLAPEGSIWHEIIRDMAEAWKTAPGADIAVRIYPGGVAGDEADMIRKMRIGQLHAAALTGTGLAKIAPEILALQMPMMLRSDAELDYVRQRLGPRLEAILEAKGFKLLTWGDAGWVHVFAQRPVVYPDDLKPLKLFTWAGDTATLEAWKKAGFRPVPLAATDIHTALQSGLINAFTTTPIAALSFQWFGLAKHMTNLNWAPLIGAIVISTRTWRELPDEAKPVLLRAARNVGKRLTRVVPKLGDEAVEVMKKHGLVVHQVPDDAVAAWERGARAGYASLVDVVVPAAMVAEVERLRDAYRASLAAD